MRNLVSNVLLMTVSSGAFALGLGNIELSSSLNQPFDARIELLSPTSTELDSLNIRVADVEAFNRAGIEWTLLLSSLRFEIEINDTGPDYIHITSREAIREPFLNFLLEANWSSGRLFREYTVLLDPPLYDPSARRITLPVAPVAETPSPATGRTPEPSITPPTAASPVRPVYSGDAYGPAISTDTLWSIATRVRPDSAVSVQQMMLALLRSNPGAFIESNINGLRQGHILRIPDRDEISNTSAEAAMAEVRSQNAIWEEIRGAFAGSATQRPIGAGPQAGAGTTGSTATGDPELRLVSPGAQATGSGQSAAAFDSTGTDSADLALANEQLQSMSSENSELRSQIEESEIIIQDLRRLLELKDDELARLQQQTAAVEIEDETIVEAPEERDLVEDAVTGSVQSEEAIDESIVSLELENTIPPEPEDTVTEQITTPPAVTAGQSQPVSTGTGIVDQILSFVFANIQLVGGALGAVILGFLGFLFVSKRKAASSAEDGAAAITEFPDFEADADGMDMSATAEDLDIGDAEEAEEAEDEDIDKTAFVGELESAELAQETAEPAAAKAPEPVAAEEPEEDPLAEVNVFLAYEHFDQAEQFVRDAIEKDPNNLEFHNKLLEVFYSAGDRVKYEEEAKILHGLVGGEGPHWEMAEIMWQEISPNRALFSDPIEGDAGAAEEDETKGGGIVDLTADDDSAADDDAAADDALDFDLGGAEETASDSDTDEDVLDITTGINDVLDFTADPSGPTDEELLDLTAAVGLDSAEEADAEAEDVLNIEGDADALTEDEEDILDISAAPGGADDLLDVTAHTEVEAEDGEELLDLTAALDLPDDDETAGEAAETSAAADDNSLDFDVEGLEIEDSIASDAAGTAEEPSLDENIIEFNGVSSDATEAEGDDLEISLDEGTGQDMDSDEGVDSGLEISLDEGTGLDMDSDGGVDSGLEISLDEGADDKGIELDFANEDEQADNGISLDLDMDDEKGASSSPDIDMESTVKLPKDVNLDLESAPPEIESESTVKLDQDSGLKLEDDDDDDDDEDHTVFVPRTADAGEQSAEDEVATKLDLAKAYVELGDNDNALKILDEIIAEGNDAQRQQAEDLKGQIA
jgi:pilus assembly protein FimV